MPPASRHQVLLVFDDKHPLFGTYSIAKRIAIGIVGGSVLVIGVLMIVLPGPAFVVIPVGSASSAWSSPGRAAGCADQGQGAVVAGMATATAPAPA
jgi:hypothetical protein